MSISPHDFLTRMMILSCRFPFRVRSFYRDPISNAHPDIDGMTNSRHLTWQAMDVVLLHGHDRQPFEVEARRQGLVVVDEGNHLHVQTP